MLRDFIALLTVALGLTICSGLIAQSGDTKSPLDLPAGKIGRDEEDEEDETESIIFYGTEFEADAFFWCLDRSGSMAGQKIETLKQEVTSAIATLTNRAEFGVVAFESGTQTWNSVPVKATVANKASATAWVQALTPGGVTCMAPAAVVTLGICNASRLRQKSVIIVSDGVPNCPDCGETVAAVTSANFQRHSVNTLFIGADSAGAACMQQIASSNSGSFTQVIQ